MHNGSRIVLVRKHSMRNLEERWSSHYQSQDVINQRKREAENSSIEQSVSLTNSTDDANNCNENMPCKRRRNALIFEHENDVKIF